MFLCACPCCPRLRRAQGLRLTALASGGNIMPTPERRLTSWRNRLPRCGLERLALRSRGGLRRRTARRRCPRQRRALGLQRMVPPTSWWRARSSRRSCLRIGTWPVSRQQAAMSRVDKLQGVFTVARVIASIALVSNKKIFRTVLEGTAASAVAGGSAVRWRAERCRRRRAGGRERGLPDAAP